MKSGLKTQRESKMKMHLAVLLAVSFLAPTLKANIITEVGPVDGANIGYELLSWKTDSATLMAQPWWGNKELASQFALGASAFQDYSGPTPFYGPFFAYAVAAVPNSVYGVVYYVNFDPFVWSVIPGADLFSLNSGGDPAVGNGATLFAVYLPDAGSTACLLAMGCVGLFLVRLKSQKPGVRPGLFLRLCSKFCA